MRGDIALTGRLLLRGTGLAGLAAAVGGLLAIVAATRPWYVSLARVEMLGEDQSRQVEAVTGLPTVLWAWGAFVAGLIALGVGLAIAVDRPYRRSRALLAATALVLAGAALGAGLTRPEPARIAGSETQELLLLADHLPVGVVLDLSSATGPGVYLALAAAVLVVAGSAGARDV